MVNVSRITSLVLGTNCAAKLHKENKYTTNCKQQSKRQTEQIKMTMLVPILATGEEVCCGTLALSRYSSATYKLCYIRCYRTIFKNVQSLLKD